MGQDYRGVPVIAVHQPVPGRRGFWLPKLMPGNFCAASRSGAFAAARHRRYDGGAGLIIMFLWRNKTAEYVRKQYEAELANKVLSQRFDT